MTPLDYITIEADVLKRQDLSPTAKMLLGLVQGCNCRGLHVSNESISDLLAVKVSTVSHIIRDLSDKKLIRIENSQSRYRRIYSAENGKVESDSTLPIYTPTLPIYTPTLPKSADINKKNLKELNICANFCAFWKAYPKKRARKNALKAFNKIKPDAVLFETLMAALETQKQSAEWLKNSGQFIPLAATWLNGERWADEVECDPGVSAPAENPEDTAAARRIREQARQQFLKGV